MYFIRNNIVTKMWFVPECGDSNCVLQCPFDGQPENVCNCPRGSKIPTSESSSLWCFLCVNVLGARGIFYYLFLFPLKFFPSGIWLLRNPKSFYCDVLLSCYFVFWFLFRHLSLYLRWNFCRFIGLYWTCFTWYLL